MNKRLSIPLAGLTNLRVVGVEITEPPQADVNADGVINVLDLVIVANALGEETPELNGDGVVNVLDLVIVANAF